MKTKLEKNKINTPFAKNKDFDILVKKLQQNSVNGCCSDKNVCDIRCSPLYGGCGNGGRLLSITTS